MKRNIAIFAGLLLAILGIAATTQVDWLTNIKNKPGFEAREYAFAAQAPGGSLSASVPATITLRPVPKGLNSSDSSHWVYLSGGTGTAEAVLITGGVATAGAATGTLTFTPANSHSGAWTISSATAGIQEAATAVNAVGGGLVSYSGTHATYAPIGLFSNVELVGDGQGSSVITCTGGNYDCIDLTNVLYSAVRRLKIQGSGRTGGWAIISSATGWSEMTDLYISDTGSGIWMNGNFVMYIKDIMIRNMPGGYGILNFGGGDQHIENIVMDNDVAGFAFAGIDITATGGMTIHNVDMLHCSHALLVNPPVGAGVVALEVSQSWFDSSTVGISVLPEGSGVGGTHTVTDFRCTDCWTTGTANCVEISGDTQDITFKGLLAFGCGNNGVVVAGNSVNILDSTIGASSLSSPGTYDNISVAAGVSGFRIQNSAIGGTYYGNVDHSHFNLNLSGASDNFIVSGNIFTPSAGGFAVIDTSTGTHARVHDNVGYNPRGLDTITPGASPYTYTAGHEPEVVYITGGTVSSILRGGAIPVAAGAPVSLPPNGTLIVTYSSVPTMYKDIQ